MADPTMTPPAAPAPPAPPAAAAPNMMNTMLAGLSQSELMVAGGAALLVVTGLLFTVIAGYGLSDLVFVSAVFALVLVMRRQRLPAVIAANYTALVFAVGALLVIVAARDLLGDLVFIATPPAGLSAGRLIGMVGFYLGVVLVGVGAWQLWSRRSA